MALTEEEELELLELENDNSRSTKRIDDPGGLGGSAPSTQPEQFAFEDLGPLGGAIMGGVLAAPIPIPGARIVGAVAGGIAGEAGRQKLRDVGGKPKEEFPLLKEAGIGLAGEVISASLFKGLGKLLFFPSKLDVGFSKLEKLFLSRSGRKVGQEEAGRGVKEGFRKKLGRDISETRRKASSVFEETQKAQRQTLGGEETARKQILLDTEDVITNNFREFRERYGSSTITDLEAGKGIQGRFGEIVKLNRAVESNYYKEVPGNLPASDLSETKNFIEELFERLGITQGIEFQGQIIPREILETAGQKVDFTTGELISRLSSIDPKALKPLQAILKDLQLKDLTFNDLKRIRTMIGSVTDFDVVRASGMDGAYKNLYIQLTADMQQSAIDGGFEAAAKKANDFSRQLFEFSGSKSAKAIKMGDASGVLDALFTAKTPDDISFSLKNVLPVDVSKE